MCAKNVVRALFAGVVGRVALGQVVASQSLVPHDAGAVEVRILKIIFFCRKKVLSE